MGQSDVMHTFCLNLNRIRQERGLTQSQLAQLLGTTQSNVSRLLRGCEDVSLSRVERIASVLGVTVADLLNQCEHVT